MREDFLLLLQLMMLAHYAKAYGGSSCLIPTVILPAIVIPILTDEQN